jgi:hypothetical protein
MARSIRRILTAGTVLALTISTTQAAQAVPRTSAASGQVATRTVTLISGDRVIVSAARSPLRTTHIVKPAAGREHMGFASYTAAGHSHVIPADALRLVTAGKLDRRLFDITGLVESGYDDAHRGTLPLIITYDGAARAAASVAGGTVTRVLPSINGAAVSADKKGAATLWSTVTAGGSAGARSAAPGIRKVWLDGARRSTLDRSVPQIGAPAAWAAGFTGTGVKVAVLDSGVDETHPDLAGRQVAERNFSESPDNVDRAGHGTHVASIATGSGAKYKGVAFGASILDGKVLTDEGFGLESWIIAGMEWAVEQGAKVANLSLGGGDTPEIDPLEEAVNTLSAQHGILFVIAAGNSGGAETVSSPGSADAALTVGAVDRDDSIAPFSSRGPRTGDGAIKPDITAPGVEIVAAKAAEGFLGTPVVDGYVSLSGTSMATPHVAGSAALLAQQHPDWTGAQLKAVLTASAKPNATATVFDLGSGRVDVAKAISQTVATEPTNVSLGTQAWPHNDDQPVTKSLTYHNYGSSAVTLNLRLDTTGPGGILVPSGVFTLSANQINVPAGGTARVSLTADTRVATVDGAYTGAITASAGDVSVRTPVAINREPESYNLTLNHLGKDGNPTTDYAPIIIGLDNDKFSFPFDPDGSVTVRLPKGRYLVADLVFTVPAGGTAPSNISMLIQPSLTLNRDTAIQEDARVARPVRVTTPDPASTLALADIGFDVQTPLGSSGASFITDDLSLVDTGQLGPAAPPGDRFLSHFNTQWTAPSGAFYGLAWFVEDTLPTGFTKVVRQRDLATVQAEFGSVTPNRAGGRFAFPSPIGASSSGGVAVVVDVPLPGKRTEFYNPDAAWSTGLFQIVPDEFTLEAEFDSPVQTFRAGKTYRASFNHGMFGPAFPATAGFPWAGRLGDDVFFQLPLFGDGAGNAGFSVLESSTITLFRNGQEVPGGGFYTVPPETADYRLTVDSVRPRTLFDVTTEVSAAWTFRSGHVNGNVPAPLPLSAIRFSPKLDDTNTAPAGRGFLIPVTLQLQSGDQIRARGLTIDVSYDEGKTWHKADVIAGLAVLLHHPANATSVSLRASANDGHGNTVQQSVIRAYKLAKK